MTQGLTPAQADGWEQYLRQEPFGDECLYLALICTMLHNANVVPQNGRPATPKQMIEYVEYLKSGNTTPQPPDPQRAAEQIRAWGMSLIQIAK